MGVQAQSSACGGMRLCLAEVRANIDMQQSPLEGSVDGRQTSAQHGRGRDAACGSKGSGAHHQSFSQHRTGAGDQKEVEEFLEKFNRASVTNKGLMLSELKQQAKKTAPILTKEERKALRKVYRKELVKRSAFLKIVAAWVITVPMSGLMAAMLFFTIRGMLLH